MDASFVAFEEKAASRREHRNQSDNRTSPTSVTSSSDEDFIERPPSRAGWYDDCEEVQFSERYEAQPFYEFHNNNNNNNNVDSGFPSSRKRSRSSRRRVWDESRAGAPKFKCRRARSLNPSTYHARERKHKRVAAGWAEVFSAISEEHWRDEDLERAYSSSTGPSTLDASTRTQETCGVAGGSASTSKNRTPAAAVASTSSERLGLHVPETASERGFFPGASSKAMLEEQSGEIGVQATSSETLVCGAERNSRDEVPENEESIDSTKTSGGLVLLRMFLPALRAGLEKFSVQNLRARLFGDPLPVESSAMAENELTASPYVEAPAHAVAPVSGKMVSVERHLYPAPYEKLVEHGESVHPNRNYVLILTVCLLVAVFVVASTFFVSASSRFGLSPDQLPKRAANVEFGANATNLGSKRRPMPAANKAAVGNRSRTTITLSSASLKKHSTSAIAEEERVRNTRMSNDISVTSSVDPPTQLTNLSSVFGDKAGTDHLSSTSDDAAGESATLFTSSVSQSLLVRDEETFVVYDKNDTKLADDVF
ncbi:uncharacterized protein [Dermacentor albipictus]|uniref:uncharacterized protein n=1 Tax=Dermacentor albipictus TaxID=60249 RepID=UPI0038FC0C0C